MSLQRDSALLLQGDLVPNTWLICDSIRRSRKLLLMQMVCRVNEQWLFNNTPHAWQERVGLVHGMAAIIHREVVMRVGRPVLGRLVKHATVEAIETSTKAKVLFLFEKVQVRCYGSRYEVDLAAHELQLHIRAIRREMVTASKIQITIGRSSPQLKANLRAGLVCDEPTESCGVVWLMH